MTDEEYQIRRKYENRNLMQELEWVSHYPPSGMSNQNRAFIRWLAMTAYDKINELEQTSVPVHDMELILDEVAKPQWISVTERLPDEYVSVLCYCSRNGQYGCGERCKEDNGTIYWIGLNGMIPTHWMPIPDRPKEGE